MYTKGELCVLSGLQVMIVCQCRFMIVCNVPLQWGMLILGEAVHVGGAEGMWKISIAFTQFCCEPKVDFKK